MAPTGPLRALSDFRDPAANPEERRRRRDEAHLALQSKLSMLRQLHLVSAAPTLQSFRQAANPDNSEPRLPWVGLVRKSLSVKVRMAAPAQPSRSAPCVHSETRARRSAERKAELPSAGSMLGPDGAPSPAMSAV